jgi:DNA-binding response OmpR family regulator
MAKSILLVEDHTLSRQSFATFLVREGYEVTDVGDGETALEVLAKSPFDLVITDQRLPTRVNGIEVLAHQSRIESGKGILVTGFGSEEVQKQARALGVEYMEKPVLLADLLHKVRELLRA